MSLLPHLNPVLNQFNSFGNIFVNKLVSLPTSHKVIIVTVSASVALLGVLAKYMRRKRQILDPTKYRRITGKRSRASGIKSPNGDIGSSVASWSRRSIDISRADRNLTGRAASVATASERASQASGSFASHGSSHHTLGPGDPVHLTPQQLGAMGVEALETAISYWEDALAAYQSGGGSAGGNTAVLLGLEDSTFCRELQELLDAAYQLQEQSEMLFLDQRSALFGGDKLLEKDHSHPLNRSPAEDSFASAVADLRDFDDCPELSGDPPELYSRALRHLEDGGGIPCRSLRTELVGCGSDSEYLAKLHCLRLATQHMLSVQQVRIWCADAGRQTLADMLLYADRDPKEFLISYEAMLEFVRGPDNWTSIEEELRARGVKALTFFDIVLDYILMDAFEDLDSPPSSVTAVVQNRWLSDGFKETALATAVWSVLKAKRRMLRFPNGFMAHFYTLSEQLLPLLAWGFLGPDESLRDACMYFRDQVIGLLVDMFNFNKSRFTSIEELSSDILGHFKQRVNNISQRLCAQ